MTILMWQVWDVKCQIYKYKFRKGEAAKLYYSSIFTLLRRRHDFLPRFLFIETTETEKKTKKKARLFINGHFEVILCSCQFDNF
jgi:isocitrate dehydrogenase kinase/phosphatase